jgi:hypothetical protein
VLDRNRSKRKFRRITGAALESLLPGSQNGTATEAGNADQAESPPPGDSADQAGSPPPGGSADQAGSPPPGGSADQAGSPPPGGDPVAPTAEDTGTERLPDTD